MDKKYFLQDNLFKFFDWLIRMICYALILMFTAHLFKNTLYIDSSYYGLWYLLAAILIYLLNKTIKPILVKLTIPITGLTLGLFYPFINVLILKLTDWLLGKHFEITSLLSALIFAILLSISTFIVNEIIKKIIDKVKK